MEDIRNEAMDYRPEIEEVEVEQDAKSGMDKKIIGGVAGTALAAVVGFAATKLIKRRRNKSKTSDVPFEMDYSNDGSKPVDEIMDE